MPRRLTLLPSPKGQGPEAVDVPTVDEAMVMAQQAVMVDFEEPAPMVCPNCGAHDPRPATVSDDATTTCPRCGHRFPVDDLPVAPIEGKAQRGAEA